MEHRRPSHHQPQSHPQAQSQPESSSAGAAAGAAASPLRRATTVLGFLRRAQPDPSAAPPLSTEAVAEFAELHTARESFALSPFGHLWYSDVLVVYTNALRRETKALFLVLYTLHRRLPHLELGDIQSFFIWYHPYQHFVCAVVNLLQDTFLRWVERDADFPASTPRTYFDAEAARIVRTVKKTLSHKDVFVGYAPSKAATKLREIFTAYVARLLKYLRTMEETTGMMIHCHSTQEEASDMSKLMIANLKDAPYFPKNIVLLLRWLNNRPTTSVLWRKEHLDIMSYIWYGRWKRPGPSEECMLYFRNMAKVVPEIDF